ncbi:MAG: hypothetical protein ABW116_04130 [Candidatus Sedimenticola sp. 20ELBAFRAG]
MKLIRSKAEKDYREQLIRSHKSLFEDEEKRRVLLALREYYPGMKSAYTIDWIPEQGEDIYRILVNANLVATVEVDRLDNDSQPFIEDISLDQYQRKLSKSDRIKLAVAIDLAKSSEAD